MKKNLGQSIFELIVALGIAAIVVVGLLRVTTTSINNVVFSRTQGEATRLSQAAFEWIRQERDNDWDAFFTRTNLTWCLSALSWTKSTPCSSSDYIAGTQFIREATLTQRSTNVIEVLLTVSWSDNLGEHEVRLDSRLTNWRETGG